MISVGVDIGTYSIKIAEVESTSKSYIIRRVQEFPLSLDLTKDKKIEIIDTLRNVFTHYDREKLQFVFAVPQNAVSMRLVDFPFRERFKVQKAVVSQLEDDLPFSQEDAVFDIKIVRFRGKASEVLAMAVPKERVGDILNMAHDCGVEPAAVSAESLGLSNLFERWNEPPPETFSAAAEIPGPRSAEIVLNIGHLSTQLLVFCEGVLLAVRNLDWGAKSIADAIAAKYGINYLQGMRELQLKGAILIEKGTGTKEQIAFSNVIETSLQDLVALMRLKMLEMQSEFKLQWTTGLISGGAAQLKNLPALLTQNFEIPFNRYKQFEHHPAVVFEFNGQLESTTCVAVGLAIEGLKRPRNPATNFLKDEFLRQSQFFEGLWERWGNTVQIASTAFVLLLIYGMFRESLTQRLLDESDRVLKIQAEAVANLKGKRASNSQIQKFLNNMEKEAKNRKQAERVVHINSALDVLNLLSASLPPKANLPLEIKRISIDNEIAEVHGYTNSPNDTERVQQALQKLSTSGRTENVNPMITPPPGKVGFAYRIRVQRFAGG